MSELVWDGYLQAPNSRVRVRLLGWILVIVRRVVVVAWVRCEIFVSLDELCGLARQDKCAHATSTPDPV